MTDQPINIPQLREAAEAFGPPEYISYDQEPDYWQVYGDNGTVCETDERFAKQLHATARDYRRSMPHDIPDFERLRTLDDALARFTWT